MKEEIISNLAGIIEYVKQGADFVKEQAPLYVQELLKYYTYISIFYTIICIGLFVFCLWLMFKTYDYLKEELNEDMGVLWAFFIGGMIICFVLAMVNIETLIQVTIAPRVFVVEKLMSICK